jgi:hypothetical protein
MVLKLEAVIELSPLAEVLGVAGSVGDIWFALVAIPCDGVSTFNEGVLLSDALDDALLRGSPDLYAFSPCVSLCTVSQCSQVSYLICFLTVDAGVGLINQDDERLSRNPGRYKDTRVFDGLADGVYNRVLEDALCRIQHQTNLKCSALVNV